MSDILLIAKMASYARIVRKARIAGRGSGVLPKGQHSWNISVMKEARIDPEVVLELSTECLFRESFFACKKLLKQTNILQNDASSSLIGYKTGRAH